MGGSGVKHKCIVKISAKARDNPRYRHKVVAARAAIPTKFRFMGSFINMAACAATPFPGHLNAPLVL